MLQNINRFTKKGKNAEKKKGSARTDQNSGQSCDKTVSGGVGTSPDLSVGSGAQTKSKRNVGAHELQEQSTIISPDAETIVTVCEESALPDFERTEGSVQKSREASDAVFEGYSHSRMDTDRRDVPDIGRDIRTTDDQNCSGGDPIAGTVGGSKVQKKRREKTKEASRGEKSSRSHRKDHRIDREGVEGRRKAFFGDLASF